MGTHLESYQKASPMAYLELAPPKRQRAWGWPAVVNLTLGGAGSGLYLIGTFVDFWGDKWSVEAQLIPFQILALLFVCVGFLSVAIEAGRPMRAFRLVANLGGSWMSIESFSGAIFLFFGIGAQFFPHFFLDVMAALAALVFITSQGMMVFRAKALEAWNNWFIPVLFVTSGFVTASGLVLLNTRDYFWLTSFPMVFILFITILNLFIWVAYLWCRGDHFKKAVSFLRHPVILLLIVGIGHLVPMFFLLAMHVFTGVENVTIMPVFFHIVSGMMLIIGGVGQKIGIVLAAGFLRPIFLKPEKTDVKAVDAT